MWHTGATLTLMKAEIRLRVPNMKDRPKDAGGFPIDHSDLRFRTIIELATRPREGDSLVLQTQAGVPIPARIARVDIDEVRQVFVLSCQYGRRSMTAEEYEALATDPAWQLKHLLD